MFHYTESQSDFEAHSFVFVLLGSYVSIVYCAVSENNYFTYFPHLLVVYGMRLSMFFVTPNGNSKNPTTPFFTYS